MRLYDIATNKGSEILMDNAPLNAYALPGDPEECSKWGWKQDENRDWYRDVELETASKPVSVGRDSVEP